MLAQTGTEKPLVAIQCLVYNHEKYLRDCLDGFVMQKTNFKFVAIVHDDVSTDNSASIIKEYEQKYPDIIKPIYETENQYSKGFGAIQKVMNEACDNTGAKYIALCEGDDYWTDPYKLQKQVDFMEINKNYIACFHNARIDYGNNSFKLFNSLNENNTPSTYDIIKRRWFISTQTLMYRNITLLYPNFKKNVISQDYLLELLLASKGGFYYMDDVMAVYRQHGGGESFRLNADKIKMYDQLIYLLENMRLYFPKDYNLAFDESIQNYINKKNDIIKSSDPILRWFYRKTYTRAIKKIMRNICSKIL